MTCIPATILAIDQGTTSSRAIVFRHACSLAPSRSGNLPSTFRDQAGERDPEDIWRTVLQSAAISGLTSDRPFGRRDCEGPATRIRPGCCSAVSYRRPIRALTHASTAGNCCAEKSTSIMMRS
jgi:hypothetical protein